MIYVNYYTYATFKYNLAINFVNDWKIYFEQTLKLKIRIRGCAKSDIRPIPNTYYPMKI